MHSSINCIRIDILKIRLIFGRFIFYPSARIKFNQLIFVAFIFNQNRVLIQPTILDKKLCIWTISTRATILRVIIVQCFINFCV